MPLENHDTREGWLKSAAVKLTKLFEEVGHVVPENVQYSCGWPLGKLIGSDRTIGQFWPSTQCAQGKFVHVFISPELDQPVRVLDVLLHELCHAILGAKVGHRKPFKELVRKLGLDGKATATFAAVGSKLHMRLTEIASDLGAYPHVSLAVPTKKKAEKQNWIRLYSPSLGKEYRVNITNKIMEAHGRPKDPLGEDMITKEELAEIGGDDGDGE